MAAAERETRLAELAAAAIAGALWLFFTAPPTAPDRDFVRAVAALGPHPRLAAIAEGLGIGFPLVRQVDGVWVQRTQGMLLTSGARRLIDENPGDVGACRAPGADRRPRARHRSPRTSGEAAPTEFSSTR